MDLYDAHQMDRQQARDEVISRAFLARADPQLALNEETQSIEHALGVDDLNDDDFEAYQRRVRKESHALAQIASFNASGSESQTRRADDP